MVRGDGVDARAQSPPGREAPPLDPELRQRAQAGTRVLRAQATAGFPQCPVVACTIRPCIIYYALVQLLLVRHGHAGSKGHWRGDDRLRPLSRQGLAEAEALTRLLSSFAPARIVSSPFTRCVQTVTPLAKEMGLRVERTKRLSPSAGKDALSMLKMGSRNQSGAIVLCTHGEVIHDLQEALGNGGHELFGKDRPRDKGSVWILHREAGRIVSAQYFPPLSTRAGESVQLLDEQLLDE